MMAMRLKQIEEMLHPIPGRDATATLMPRDAIATESVGTHGGTRDRSRREVNQRRAAPTMSVAANVSRMLRS